ncbi:hypothetical protein AKO1_008013 [Acrasis kona]|uniref:Fe2OG dioxygenase domain-containing protein n=1 Tax=Acrasis kona TaxID=1008807 RepID=A0AAW2YP36_9EUKA
MKELPVVDISAFVKPDSSFEDKEKTAKHVHKVCSEIGFFYLVGHGISDEVVNGAHTQAREFFAQPKEVKDEISIRKSPHFRGYQCLGENVTKSKRDWHEAIDLYKDVPPNDSNPIHGHNQWPEKPENFRSFFENYDQQMDKLGRSVMRAIAMSLGLEEHYFDKYINDSYMCMRIINYPPLSDAAEQKEENVGDSCGVHCDYGLLTFVNQDSTKNALWVQDQSGEWISANPLPGSFTVNLGDMLKLWTSNLYQSTPHKVIHTNSKAQRTSIPYFFEPNFDAIISPLPLSDSLFEGKKKPEPFQPKKYGDHLTSKVLGNFTFGDTLVKKGYN